MGSGRGQTRRTKAAASAAADFNAAALDLYLLVYPQHYIYRGWSVLGDVDLDEEYEREDDYAAEASLAAQTAKRAICILDPADIEGAIESLDEGQLLGAIAEIGADQPSLAELAAAAGGEVADGVPAGLFEILEADSADVEAIVRKQIGAGKGRVGVGGFARDEYLTRIILALRELGWDANFHEATAIPLARA